MLRRTLIKGAALLAMASAMGFAQAYTAGEHYLELDAPYAAARGTVTKIWTIGCPFCYRYAQMIDPALADEIKKKAGLALEPLLLESPGEANRAASEFMTYVRRLDRKAGRGATDENSLYQKAEKAWFSGFHDRGERWETPEALLKVAYEATGVEPADFEAARKTTELQEATDANRWTYEAATRYGVPAYVVNGRYLVLANKLKGYDDMVKMIVELSQKK